MPFHLNIFPLPHHVQHNKTSLTGNVLPTIAVEITAFAHITTCYQGSKPFKIAYAPISPNWTRYYLLLPPCNTRHMQELYSMLHTTQCKLKSEANISHTYIVAHHTPHHFTILHFELSLLPFAVYIIPKTPIHSNILFSSISSHASFIIERDA